METTVIKLTTVHKLICAAVLVLTSATCLAQRSSELSDDFPDGVTMAVQDKVEHLFDAGEFERAFFIYRNELVPIGDKYAQYMVGFMYETGLGVAEDIIAAAAWYQLAAERDTREFVVVRDRVLHTMSQRDADRSRLRYLNLRLQYCDLAVLLSSIKRNMKDLRGRTGSRIMGQSSPLTVIETRTRTSRPGSDYYAGIQKELEARITLLKEIADFEDLATDPGRINMRDLERRVLQYIESEY